MRQTAFQVLARSVFSGLLLVFVAGCGARTPPPPPPPPPQVVAPPPPPEPVKVSEEQIARCLRPCFYVLFDRGFRPSAVDSPDRYPVAFVDGRIQASPTQPLTPPVQKSIDDAKNTTPDLQTAITEQLRGGTLDVQDAIVEWVTNMQVRSTGTSAYISNRNARRFVLGMYVAQALADADAQNFHRAHVLLGDVSRVLGADNDFAGIDQFADFRRFFLEVPDGPRYESFAKRLEKYIRDREESLIVSGEDAAILNVVGLSEAATFMREKLSARFNLVILPLIETAIMRGEGYGFSPPPQLAEMRRRLAGHAEALAGEKRRDDREAFRGEVVKTESEKDYQPQFAAFEAMVRDASRPGPDGGSVEKAVRSLQASPRSVVDWVREKLVCARYCPLYMVKPSADFMVIEIGHPLVYAPQEEAFKAMNLAALATDDKGTRLGESIGAWCAGAPLAENIRDGAGHYMLAWYWLERGRPQLARMALLAGAGHLLTSARDADLEHLRSDPGRNALAMVAAMQAEFNAYRMLLAAAAITSTPAGAPFDSGDSYLAELQVLMTAWRQSWLKCGLPEAAANDAVRHIDAESRRVAAVEAAPQRDRYHFFDYRFEYGSVPDVVVERAHEKELLGADGKFRGGDAGMTAFVRSFDLPVEFSKASRVRWASR